MTLAEFKAWFEGYTESLDGPPNNKQWKRIADLDCCFSRRALFRRCVRLPGEVGPMMTKPDLIDQDLPPLEFVHQKGKHDALMTLGFVFVICLMAFLFGLVALL